MCFVLWAYFSQSSGTDAGATCTIIFKQVGELNDFFFSCLKWLIFTLLYIPLSWCLLFLILMQKMSRRCFSFLSSPQPFAQSSMNKRLCNQISPIRHECKQCCCLIYVFLTVDLGSKPHSHHSQWPFQDPAVVFLWDISYSDYKAAAGLTFKPSRRISRFPLR